MASRNSSGANHNIRSCTTRRKNKSFSFLWTIEEFTSFLEDENSVLRSSSFHNQGVPGKWKIRLDPVADLKCEPGHVSVYIEYTPCPPDHVQTVHSFKVTLKSKSNNDYSRYDTKRYFSTAVPAWGWVKFISHELLRSRMDDLCPNNTVQILFEAQVLDVTVTSPTSQVCVRSSELVSDLEKLLVSEMDSDVMLVTGSDSIPAHKFILSARSPVFEAMFRHDMLEKHSRDIRVHDVRPDVMREVVRYIYTDKEPEKMSDMAQELLVVANMYDLARLKEMCERHLSGVLCLDNVLTVLELASNHNAEQLKKVCLQFVSGKMEQLTASPAWKDAKHLPPEVLVELLEIKAKPLSKKCYVNMN